MNRQGVFSESAPRLYTIAPGANFLGALAATLADEFSLKKHPDALADALIYVPNRRSARALAAALHTAAGGAAIIAPEIRALGDLETDEPPTGAEEAVARLGPALDPARRLGALAALCRKFLERINGHAPPSSALAAAQELIRLLDQSALAGGVDWSDLPNLADGSELAAHWQDSAEFLKIVSIHWPEWLKAQGVMEPFERRLAVAEAIATSWTSTPPTAPVLIAGSTGATPASRSLMAAAAKLPLGRIVFPGLDRDATPDAWTAISQSSGHPQFAFVRTLASLGVASGDVEVWPSAKESARAEARRQWVNEALAPAAETADWLERLGQLAGDRAPSAFATDALAGLSILDAEDEADESRLAALMLRETLETPGATAALVTPDPSLARRVTALLHRWDVAVAPSGGEPLLRAPAGSLVGLVLQWLTDPADPVSIAALAKHSLVAEKERIGALERIALRGPRRWERLEELRTVVLSPPGEHQRRSAEDVDAAVALIDRLTDVARTADGLASAKIPEMLAKICAGLLEALNALVHGDALWAGEDGAATAGVLEALIEIAQHLGEGTVSDVVDLYERLAGAALVSTRSSHPRLSIWGPLEARLQSADRIILAGLNEDVWPNLPPPDGFLPRRFRDALGLPEPEERLGLAAHDFAQLACAPDVTLLYSKRRDDGPAVASRWVWRLKTLAEGALSQSGAEDALAPPPHSDPRRWVDALTQSPEAKPARHAEPRPKPPRSARPDRLSVTRIDTLQRDPYAIYAEKILGLSALDPLGAPVDARAFGTATHKALETLEDETEDQTADRLLLLVEIELKKAGVPDAELRSTRAARRETCTWYVGWRDERSASLSGKPKLETSGTCEIALSEGPFVLSAKADRIEQKKDGSLAILDFKTGQPPSDKQIATGLSQQMPLQALIAARGGFAGLPASPVSELGYLSFRARHEWRVVGNSEKSPFADKTPTDMAAAADAGIERLIRAYQSESQAYLSAPRVQFVTYDYGYNRLARRAEWAGETSDD